MNLLRRFVLRDATAHQSMSAFVQQNWLATAKAERPLQVVVSEYKAKRRDEQNALMWAHLAEISEQAWTGGRRFAADIWHEHFKRTFLPEMCAKGVAKWTFLPDGATLILRMSTTDLNITEFAAYWTECQAHAATELGVQFRAIER